MSSTEAAENTKKFKISDKAKRYILETLVFEIYKDGIVDSHEKEIYKRIAKVLGTSREQFLKVKSSVVKHVEVDRESGSFSAEAFLNKVRACLQMELKTSQVNWITKKFSVAIQQTVYADEINYKKQDLLKEINNSNPGVRALAIRDIAVSPLEDRLELLENALEKETDVQLKYELRKAINEIAHIEKRQNASRQELSPKKIDFIRNKIRSNEEGERNKALSFIIKNNVQSFLPEILELEQNSNSPYLKLTSLSLLGFNLSSNVDKIRSYLQDSDPRVLAKAIELLEEAGDSKSMAYITKFIQHSNNRVRANALKALYNLGDTELFRLLVKMAQSKSSAFRDSAAFAISSLEVQEAVKILIKLSADPELSIRKKAIRGLRNLEKKGNQEAAKFLEQLNVSGSDDVETSATQPPLDSGYQDLKIEGIESEAEEMDVKDIQVQLRFEADAKVISSLMIALGKLKNPCKDAVDILVAHLTNKNLHRGIHRIRANALESLSQIPDSVDAEFMFGYIWDDDNRCAGNAIVAIAQYPEFESQYKNDTIEAIQRLAVDLRVNFRLTAIYCIGIIMIPELFPFLYHLANDSEAQVANKARQCLDMIRTTHPEILKEIERQLEEQKVAEEKAQDEANQARAAQEKAKNQVLQDRDDFIDFLVHISKEDYEFFEKISHLRKSGEHKQALHFLLGKKLFDEECRYLIAGRLNLEINRLSKAKSFLGKVQDPELKSLAYRENFFCDLLNNKKLDLQDHCSALDIEDFDYAEGVHFVCNGLLIRNNASAAFHYLKNLEDLEELPSAKEEFERISARVYFDNYLSYKGFFGIITQLLLAFGTLYLIQAQWPLLKGGFLSQWKLFPNDLNYYFCGKLILRSMESLLYLMVMIPAVYFPLKSLLGIVKGRFGGSTEINPAYLKINSMGSCYHINLTDKKKSLQIYEDENDYSFSSLIRFLPFIPHFTYIYGFDQIREIYVLKPVYGIADGKNLKQRWLGRCKHAKAINLLGIRAAQFAQIIAWLNSIKIGYLLPPLVLGSYLYLGLGITGAEHLTSNAIPLAVCTFLFIFYYLTPRLFDYLINRSFLSLFFQSSFLILALYGLLLAWSLQWFLSPMALSLIPVVFFLLFTHWVFLKDRNVLANKQFLSDIMGTWKNSYHDQLRQYSFKGGPFGLKIYFNRFYMALPYKVFMIPAGYQILQRRNAVVQVLDKESYCKVQIGPNVIKVKKTYADLSQELAEQGLEILNVKSVKGKWNFPSLLSLISFVAMLAWIAFVNLPDQVVPSFKPHEFATLDKQKSLNNLEFFETKARIKNSTFEFGMSFQKEDSEILLSQKKVASYEDMQNSFQVEDSSPLQAILRELPMISSDSYRDSFMDYLWWEMSLKKRDFESNKYPIGAKRFCEYLAMDFDKKSSMCKLKLSTHKKSDRKAIIEFLKTTPSIPWFALEKPAFAALFVEAKGQKAYDQLNGFLKKEPRFRKAIGHLKNIQQN